MSQTPTAAANAARDAFTEATGLPTYARPEWDRLNGELFDTRVPVADDEVAWTDEFLAKHGLIITSVRATRMTISDKS